MLSGTLLPAEKEFVSASFFLVTHAGKKFFSSIFPNLRLMTIWSSAKFSCISAKRDSTSKIIAFRFLPSISLLKQGTSAVFLFKF